MRRNPILISALALLITAPVLAKSPGKMPPPQPTPNPAPAPAPQQPGGIRVDYAPGELTKLCDEALATYKARLDAIGALRPEERTVDSALLAMENAGAEYADAIVQLTFMSYVTPNEALSKESLECKNKSEAFDVEVSSRRDLYNAIAGLKGRNKSEARLLQKSLEGFEDSGMKLSDSDLAKFVDLRKELTKVESEFQDKLNNDASTIEFTPEELDGLPPSFFVGREKTSGGKYVLTAKTPDYVPVMQYAKNPETRRKIQILTLNTGGSGNVSLLEDAVELRQKIAKLMGFDTWADYKLARKMAKDKKTVMEFLNGLRGKLAMRNKADLDLIFKAKKEEFPDATKLDPWDVTYYKELIEKRDYSVDKEKVREYFPSDVVIKGVFAVYSKILGVKYVEEKNAKVWADGVKLYGVYDAKTGKKISYFYADLFPRKGKYNHAAAFSLKFGRRLPNGAYTMPVSAIVSNFSPPRGDQPSMLPHDDVETFFHEFGHIMHQVLTRAPYMSLAGTSVQRDFVEAPSQMLENWAWSPQVIDLVSGHYQDRSKKLPKELFSAMLKAKDFMQGNFYTRQLLYGLFDMTIHTAKDGVDVMEVYNGLYKDLTGLEPVAEGKFPGTFGHMMGGYDAGYYGYIWSEVYAADMFSLFEANVMSEQVGSRYRKVILEGGSMVDAIDLLRKFLGREPNNKAFFKKLGLK